MLDIITFGSATWDIFLKSKKFNSRKGICFKVGLKIDIEEIFSGPGGGGTNTAATFSNQGFKTAWCGTLGADIFGKAAIKDLKRRKIKTRFVRKVKERPTNISVILNSIGKDRTVLAYRGASEDISEKDIFWFRLRKKRFQAKWFYLAPLSGKAALLTKKIISFANKNKIKVALNPGNSQLALKDIKKIIEKVDILLLNQEEASRLVGLPYAREKEIFSRIDKFCPGIVIMTKGGKGAILSDGKKIFRAKTPKIKITDKTGAGDAFGSGFVSGFIKSGGNIEFSLRFGTANAVSCIKKMGTKKGLLKKSL